MSSPGGVSAVAGAGCGLEVTGVDSSSAAGDGPSPRRVRTVTRRAPILSMHASDQEGPRHGRHHLPQLDIGARTAELNGCGTFAGIVLFLAGTFSFLYGLAAVLDEKVVTVGGGGGGVIVWDFKAWGWAQMIIGLLMVTVSLGLFAVKSWARWGGVVFATLNALVQVGTITAFPIWALVGDRPECHGDVPADRQLVARGLDGPSQAGAQGESISSPKRRRCRYHATAPTGSGSQYDAMR